MRGHLSPAVRAKTSESQDRLRTLSRGRRTKLARAAQTTLEKVDRWARGERIAGEVAEAIERALSQVGKKK